METLFTPFPKIARLNREIVVTEKIDGTNASVIIVSDQLQQIDQAFVWRDGLAMLAASRTRLITPGDDNHGFAAWVMENSDELFRLGEGNHFGEWWGKGIQRGYGVSKKYFSLFNTSIWSDPNVRPKCCEVVPVLYKGMFSQHMIDRCITEIELNGSIAVKKAEGYQRDPFMDPEGICIYHTAAGIYFKQTIWNDQSTKGMVARWSAACEASLRKNVS